MEKVKRIISILLKGPDRWTEEDKVELAMCGFILVVFVLCDIMAGALLIYLQWAGNSWKP